MSDIGNTSISLDSIEDALDRICRVDILERQLQRKFKHTDDFGVAGNWNSNNKEVFQNPLTRHIADTATRSIDGTYRGRNVTYPDNSQTGNTVIVSTDGWKYRYSYNNAQAVVDANSIGIVGASRFRLIRGFFSSFNWGMGSACTIEGEVHRVSRL
ncbi:colicin D domain-containing protein [Halorhabdus rudnickae]|uniref:colicin D domain-containing protein n=1 Tax=Halorhabdus rudnickae TaxID=1775544 RepID=UPI00108355E7|nr:colicin D domain-containing protein [Halorhabdus rudnickae]